MIGAADSQCAAFGSGVSRPGPVSEMAGASSCLNSVVARAAATTCASRTTATWSPAWYCTELGRQHQRRRAHLGGRRPRVGGLRRAGARARERVHGGAARRARRRTRAAAAPLFLPYLGDGERDDPALRAGFIGLSDRHGRDELAYAVLEGLAFGSPRPCRCCRPRGLRWTSCGSPEAARGCHRSAQIKADVLDVPCVTWPPTPRPSAWRCWPPPARDTPTRRRWRWPAALSGPGRSRPDDESGEAVRERYRWFLDVRSSDAVRLRT